MERVEAAPQFNNGNLTANSNPLLSLSTTHPPTPPPSNDPSKPSVTLKLSNHRCCCNFIHIKFASYSISSMFAILIISNFLVKIAGLTDLEWNWELLFLCSDSIAVACLFYGTYVESAAFFQPFVVLSIITISFLILLLAYVGAAIYDPHSYPGEYLELLLHEHLSVASQKFKLKLKDVVSLFASVAAIVILFALFCHCWFVIIAIQCARYFRIKNSRKSSEPNILRINSKARRPIVLIAEPLYESIGEAYTESPIREQHYRFEAAA
uniref:Uncharacterized protein n=1 Tax=Panagrolaimus sp. PS1159 TaxID=55785 RepID=A0AC35ET57_9BILA